MIYIFDICDTLYKSNTTFKFIEFYLTQTNQKFKKGIFKLIHIKYSPLFLLLLLLGKVSSKDWHKALALWLLKGEKLSALEGFADAFVVSQLNPRIIAETHQLLHKVKGEGYRVILISASIQPVAKAIANSLNTEFLSSELVVENGIFTGSLKHDITGKKEHVLKKYIGNAEYTVVTDNFSDYNLVKSASRKYVVLHKQKHRKFWESLNPTFIIP